MSLSFHTSFTLINLRWTNAEFLSSKTYQLETSQVTLYLVIMLLKKLAFMFSWLFRCFPVDLVGFCLLCRNHWFTTFNMNVIEFFWGNSLHRNYKILFFISTCSFSQTWFVMCLALEAFGLSVTQGNNFCATDGTSFFCSPDEPSVACLYTYLLVEDDNLLLLNVADTVQEGWEMVIIRNIKSWWAMGTGLCWNKLQIYSFQGNTMFSTR